MILSFALPVVEKIINRTLRLDPNFLQKCGSIHNQIIQINCTDWSFVFYIVVTTKGLQFEKQAPGRIDTIISGTVSSFFKLIANGADSIALFQSSIEIIGNTQNLEILRDIFRQLDIDWEEELSHFLGDAIAHKLYFYVKKTDVVRAETQEKLKINMQEYLHFEARALPTRIEVEKFYVDIAALRNDVDRLEARIKQLR